MISPTCLMVRGCTHLGRADAPEPEAAARRQLGGWRARNLLMAGHLRRVVGEYPGGRVLALVGRSHRGPLQAALGTDQHDLELVDPLTLH
ncbi:hypothetical protein [Kytococcus sp. Marseille-QA3725]